MGYYNQNIALATYGSVGIQTIRKLFALGFTPDNIIVFTHSPLAKENEPLADFMDYLNIDWFVVEEDMNTMKFILNNHNTKLLLNIGYKYIYREPVIGMDDLVLINMHPGILPNYRGWLSVPWAMFNDEEYVGYTYHIITDKIDAGNIILVDSIPIKETSTSFDLHFKIHNKAIDRLDYIIGGEWGTYQQVRMGTYYHRQLPNNGYIDTGWGIEKIERFIRLMYFPPHKGAVLRKGNDEIEIKNMEQYEQEISVQ